MSRPTICVVGPLVGNNPGRVVTQGERLAEALGNEGYTVIAISSAPSRAGRLFEIAKTIVKRRHDIDVMIVFTYGGLSFVIEDIASALASRFEIPIISSMCGGAMPRFMARYPRWTRRVFDRVAAFVCQSKYLADELASHGYESTVINNMIDISKYQHQLRTSVRPRLLWMRAFEDAYNPEMPLRVLSRLAARYDDASLVMAGQDSGLQTAIEARAQTLGLGSRVRFPGFLDVLGKQREALIADVFINTPRIDNRPICVVEAGAFGLPVVSTNVGGIPFLLEDERSGMLVPDDDADAMTNAIVRLVENPPLAARLSKNGRELANASTMNTVIPKWETIIERVRR